MKGGPYVVNYSVHICDMLDIEAAIVYSLLFWCDASWETEGVYFGSKTKKKIDMKNKMDLKESKFL